jgi:hypothetical protein
LTKERKKLETFREAISIFCRSKRRALYFESFIKRNVLNHANKTVTSMQRWIDAMPSIKATFLIPYQSICQTPTPTFDYYWGYAASISQAKEMDLKVTSDTRVFAPTDCISTVFTAGGEHTFIPCMIEGVLTPLWEKGYIINRDIMGEIIARAHKPEGFKRYFEVWIPAFK